MIKLYTIADGIKIKNNQVDKIQGEWYIQCLMQMYGVINGKIY